MPTSPLQAFFFGSLYMELGEYTKLVPSSSSGNGRNVNSRSYTQETDMVNMIKARGRHRDLSWRSYAKHRISSSYEWMSENSALVVSVLVLMMSTASERVIFKMSVDRMAPFRFVLAMAFIAVSFLIYGTVMLYKIIYTDKITARMWQFPKKKLLAMAVLDTVSFSGLVISAAGVTPTMTVILLHASTPIIVFFSRFAFPDRKYSEMQIKGSNFIVCAIAFSLIRSITDMYYRTDTYNALSSVIYVASAAMQGVGTLYKEKAVIEWSQQLDIHFLSAGLFLFQTLTMGFVALVLYYMQDVYYHYTSQYYSFNLRAGFQCLLGDWVFKEDLKKNAIQAACTDTGDIGHNTIECSCSGSNLLILGYVFSNIIMLECMDHVLQTSNRILGRVMAVSVFVAFLALGVYDNKVYSVVDVHIIGTIGIADILSILCLLIGIDYNGRDAEPNVEMITSFDAVAIEGDTGIA